LLLIYFYYFSFYRFVLEPEVIFDKSGHLSPDPIAKFSNMPTSPLLTQILHVPDNWLVESVASPYDLDNIRLEDVEMGVYRYVKLNITISNIYRLMFNLIVIYLAGMNLNIFYLRVTVMIQLT